MSNFKQNGINFTIENNFTNGEKIHSVKGKISSANNPYLDYSDEDNASKLINAVEIDWNDAQVNGQTISTTGQMLSLLQQALTQQITAAMIKRFLYI